MKTLLRVTLNNFAYGENIKCVCLALRTAELVSVQLSYSIMRKTKHFADKQIKNT